MKSRNLPIEDTLPIKLKIQVLRAELGRLESDLSRLGEARQGILEEIRHHQDLLDRAEQEHPFLRRVK